MYIGINAGSFPANLSVPQGLKIAKRAGFDAVELAVTEDGYLNMRSSEADAANFRMAAKNMSLELKSVAANMLWQYPLTSGDPEIAAKAKEIVRKSMVIARWLGADTLLVIPGMVTSEVSYEEAYVRSLEALKELAVDAEKQRIHIGIENACCGFLLSPLEMRQFIDDIGSEWVGAYFDAGDAMLSGYPEHWIRILGNRILKVHAKDYKSSVGGVQGFSNILDGDMNWYAVRDALKDVGYDDVVTAEIDGYKMLPDIGLRHAGESLKRIFKGAT